MTGGESLQVHLLACRVWPFSSTVGRRRGRWNLILALGLLLLHSWLGAGHKLIDYHCFSCHHIMTTVGFHFRRAD